MVRYIYSYNLHSQGSRDLAKAMKGVRLKKQNSKFTGSPDKVVINWGATRIPEFVTNGGTRILNSPERVAIASNKTKCFSVLRDHDVRIPPMTTEYATALAWVQGGDVVLARTILNGSSGAGIVIMDSEHPDTHEVSAPLYVKYIKKRHEFRLHFHSGNDTPFLIQRKGLSREWANHNDVNPMIRNLANGYIFVRNEDLEVPEDVITQSRKAFIASRLHFGAIDVIYNEKQNKAYVLEINTAPGLVGTTVTDYATVLNSL